MARGGVAQLFEGVDDAHHGAKQAHEGSVVAHGGQECQPAFQPPVFEGGCALHGLVGSLCAALGETQARVRHARRNGRTGFEHAGAMACICVNSLPNLRQDPRDNRWVANHLCR